MEQEGTAGAGYSLDRASGEIDLRVAESAVKECSALFILRQQMSKGCEIDFIHDDFGGKASFSPQVAGRAGQIQPEKVVDVQVHGLDAYLVIAEVVVGLDAQYAGQRQGFLRN